MFEFIPNEKIAFPWICVSKPPNCVVITTKKIASRFFEDVTRGPRIRSNMNARQISIDIRFEKLTEFDTILDDRLIFDNKILESAESRDSLTYEEFYNVFNVKQFGDIFTTEYFKNNKIYIVTRNPYDRFYTGFFENIDHLAASHYPADRLANNPQRVIDEILNKFIQKVDYTIFSDAHTSLWNTFIHELLTKFELEKYTTVLDLNDSDRISSLFGVISQPSNKQPLNKWLSNPDNKPYIDEIENKLKYYFDLEMKHYNKLLTLGS